jgi:uncharacterized membrane protein YdfJ with MMPL/SSD domain
MAKRPKIVWIVLVIAAMFVVGALVRSAMAQEHDMPPASENRSVAIARERAAKQLLLLMDRNKDGKVSKEEWMSFMGAEFDRLDTNHDGFVDAKDMEKSQVQPSHFAKAGK